MRVACSLALLAACCVSHARAASESDGILCRPELSAERRRELAERLREITGWTKLHFDAGGALDFGEEEARGGSVTARELLQAATRGGRLLLMENASDRADVVFSRVVEGRWKRDAESRPAAFIVQIDFADFSRVLGDREALAAFNVGWVALHEIAHVVRDAADAERAGEAGECEALVNRMRRECDLAVRAEYHFHFFPGHERGEFKSRYVRLAFERQNPSTNKKRRLWLMWDATLVGGLGREKR